MGTYWMAAMTVHKGFRRRLRELMGRVDTPRSRVRYGNAAAAWYLEP